MNGILPPFDDDPVWARFSPDTQSKIWRVAEAITANIPKGSDGWGFVMIIGNLDEGMTCLTNMEHGLANKLMMHLIREGSTPEGKREWKAGEERSKR
jgi:hypothetical protein